MAVMAFTEKRQSRQAVNIDQRLVKEGTAQLTSEIGILENWLNELELADSADPSVVDARNSYRDMLRSRKEMLFALQNQAQPPGGRPKL